MLGLVFGESADRALVLVCLLSHAALVFGTYRLGAAVFGRWSGALAALFVAASASFLLYAARGYVDAPFLALVVWAGVLEAEGRSRERLPLALLVAAGPAAPGGVGPGGPVVARAPPRRVRARASPPRRCIWALTDLIVTGDPLHSLHATSELADDLGRVRGVAARPGLVRVVRRRDRAPAGGAPGAGRRRSRLAASSAGARCASRWRCSPRA